MRRFGLTLLLLSLAFALCADAQTTPSDNASPSSTERQDEPEGDAPRIEIVRADLLEIGETPDERFRKLYGNVELRQADTRLWCDSALFYPDRNSVRAYGHVRVKQGDSLSLTGDSLRYFGAERLTRVYGKTVRLSDRSMVLTTTDLSYYSEKRLGIYRGGGSVRNGSTLLSSKTGYYYADSETTYFRDSVRLRDPEYRLEADTLEYRIPADLAIFHGPTRIYHQNNTVFCRAGFYDGPAKLAIFKRDAMLFSAPNRLFADSIRYQRDKGFGQAWRDVLFIDSTQGISQASNYAEYYEESGVLLARDRILLGWDVEGDSMFISADTLRSIPDSLDQRVMVGWGDVRIYKSNLQGLCDSLVYRASDSSIVLYGQPVLWTDSSQFTADTVSLHLVKQGLDRIALRHAGFIVNLSDSLVYNQIKGRNIYGSFVGEELRKLEVFGNGQSLYFAKDESGAYLGVNRSLSSDLVIRVRDRQVQRIAFLGDPEATFTPIDPAQLESYRLEGFSWQEARKPQAKIDLLLDRGLSTSRPVSESGGDAVSGARGRDKEQEGSSGQPDDGSIDGSDKDGEKTGINVGRKGGEKARDAGDDDAVEPDGHEPR